MRLLRSLFKSSEPRPVPAARIRPRVEEFEPRLTPATLIPSESINGTLAIFTSFESVRIEDNGTNAPGSIRVVSFPLGGGMSTGNLDGFTKSRIFSRVVIKQGLAGSVTYDTEGRSIGAGVSRDIVYKGSNLLITNDRFKAHVGGVGPDARFNVTATGGPGNDSLEVEFRGTLARGSRTTVSMEGNSGGDTVHVNAWNSVAVESGAVFVSNLAGYTLASNTTSDGSNNVSLWYLGRMNGNLQYFLNGGGGRDDLQANLWFSAASTGWVGFSGNTSAAALFGGDGDDALRLYVRGAGIWWNTPMVHGGSGSDYFYRALVGEANGEFARIFNSELYFYDDDRMKDNYGSVRRMDYFLWDYYS